MKIIEQMPYTTEYWNQSIQENLLHQTLGIAVGNSVYWIEMNDMAEEREHQVEGLSIRTKTVRIDHHISLLNFNIYNELSTSKEIKVLIAHSNPREYDQHFSFISPIEQLIYHMIDRQLFLVNGQLNGVKMKENTVMQRALVDNNKIWSYGKGGKQTLSYNPIGKGKVVSLCGDTAKITGKSAMEGTAWSITDDCQKQLLQVNQTLLKKHTSISN
ncbi:MULTISPECIES: hypothetical protein [Cytobacillus]|uniref:Uncharacterized protein n=1 Tax=Cytobacillus stercorigallinarum TaxID=2762240 RepID=A0ABR8QKH9_9BACI|nr:hypothetical protein [Cytobacillus stercorigallinarum]MBD7935857.1 hypothetical protein [Cytobacillus stercorigallinarum]